jgi:hypothetical protein
MKSLLLVSLIALSTLALAHEADCPYCKMKVVQNTKDQDNEVVVKFGNKRIEYRCLSCVILDQGRYKSDLVVYAPSEKVGEPVILRRTAGKWIGPEGAVFLHGFKKHDECALFSRAFIDRKGWDAYLLKHPNPTAKPLTLAEFIAEVTKK